MSKLYTITLNGVTEEVYNKATDYIEKHALRLNYRPEVSTIDASSRTISTLQRARSCRRHTSATYSRDCKVRILTQGAAAYRHESILKLSKKKTSPVVFPTTERFFLLYNRMLALGMFCCQEQSVLTSKFIKTAPPSPLARIF